MNRTVPDRIVVQARASSSRLPRKAFLPLAGTPSVVLCLQRAASAGAEVMLATSSEREDDELARLVEDAGFTVVRGPLEDVLSRYLVATEDLPDDAIVARLTADNLLPDGQLVSDVAGELVTSGADLAYIPWPQSGLPYGIAVEAVRLRALRQSSARTSTAAHREHVTLELKQSGTRVAHHVPKAALPDVPQARCTLDTPSDYDTLSRLFNRLGAAAQTESWPRLVSLLIASREAEPVPLVVRENGVHSRISLGTAQFGIAYGRTGTGVEPDVAHVRSIVARAAEHGLLAIDTARSYGSAETKLGGCAEIWNNGQTRLVTKLDASEQRESGECSALAVEASILRSCHELRARTLDTVLLHRWAHRTVSDGAVWRRLVELKREGVIGRIGVSVQNPDEAREALDDAEVQHVQLPMNVLDWRWREAGIPRRIAERPDVVVHARSVFLQGILLAPPRLWPSLPGLDAEELALRLDSLVSRLGLANRLALCLRYVSGLEWIDSLVIGFDTVEQMDEVVAASAQGPLQATDIAIVDETLRDVPARLLDPAQWPQEEEGV